MFACARHRDAAILAVSTVPGVERGATLRYKPLGTHRKRIERTHDRRTQEGEN